MPDKQRVSYGVDAPGVIRNLFIAAAACFIVPLFIPQIKFGNVVIDITWLFWSGLYFSLSPSLMLIYSLYGKFKHRDRMLDLISWKGDEQVLDIGTGKGLLMIGAAHKLTTGKSIGIDIWNNEDLSGNTIENALKNAGIEGVRNKISIENENAMHMSFADNSFDVVLSNLCLHNIYNKEGRNKACVEIGRVLKIGGTAVISDFRHVKEYKQNFDKLGLQTKLFTANYLTTFPPLRILLIKK
ncbi:MAG TPA: class I SAM-dependent methyltransferase [Mucilaginibacter sp.]|jgi:ubiquinone/menaquinone biosynthesis C-methylase UbiE